MQHETPASVNLLFVCMGNTCRSPMAAAFARKLLGKGATVQSAGIAVTAIMPSLQAVKALQLIYKTDISAHCPRPVQEFALDGFTHIIALDSYVMTFLADRYPVIASKLYAWNIADPYGGNEAEYADCAAQILQRLQLWCAETGLLPAP
ncbi:hypothetical protein C7N43_26295 [Sphingobacteriales bacterium UPWRP_1]|nr:hypothetical protein B6N25_13835 [Sphingobacteriales bacterium TSM_CSS]PSJ73991.1 hypothetical protein C7N43_26295 [Sphingobacteriales bacterium UPWRP_1]